MNQTTEARRRLVRRVLADEAIHNQEQLRELLTGHGFEVTQATISRDLDAIGAVKVFDGNGGHYEIAMAPGGDDERAISEVRLVLDQFLISIAVADPLVVIKVPPGAAHLVASRVDGAAVDGVLGTVAGDDTLLVVADASVGAAAVADALVGGAP
jgi:transcriptional regulator of arginine metabolism